jgi:hypothetical protein
MPILDTKDWAEYSHPKRDPGGFRLPDDPFTHQVGGDHYKDFAIQPSWYIRENGLGWYEGNVIKYVSRYQQKGGLSDLEKARHYLDMLIKECEGG